MSPTHASSLNIKTIPSRISQKKKLIQKQNMIRWGLYRETYVVLVSPEETELHLGTYFSLPPSIFSFVSPD